MITLLYIVLELLLAGVIYLTYVAIAAQKETQEALNAYNALEHNLHSLRVAIDVVLAEDDASKEKRNAILLKYYHSAYEK